MSKSSGFSAWKWLVTAGVLAASAYGGYRIWSRSAAAPVEFQTAAVTRGDVVASVMANGSLTPVRLVEVGSQISGVITEIRADFNSKVKGGEVVAQIDPATYERALGQAEAELANAEAALELAQLNYDRSKELFANSLVSKSEYDQARVNLSQANALVKTRQANVDRAKVDLSRTTIYAPMDGVVITRRVEVGQTVAASMNAPTLLIIANDLAKMQIEAAVSEADVGGVEEGQKVQFTVDAFLGRQFEGTVQQVRYAPTTNQNVVTYTTVVAVDNRDLKLRPGMTANARFITAERKGVLKVPNAATRFRPPATARVIGDTNAPPGAGATAVALIESGPFAGLPVMPWTSGGERRRPTEEERAAYAATLTPEQKRKYEQITAEMRARMASGGGGGFGGGGGGGFGGGAGGGGGGGGERRSPDADKPREGTVYVVEKDAQGTALRAVRVKLGMSDAASVEVLDGLAEGDSVVTGTVTAAVAQNTTRNPFSPFGGPPRR